MPGSRVRVPPQLFGSNDLAAQAKVEGVREGVRHVEATDAERARFRGRIQIDPATGCWIWQGPLDRDGYGDTNVGRQHWKAHRLAWALFEGPIPEGHVLDHAHCRRRACCNTAHMRTVTPSVNALENCDSPVARNAAKTHCLKGHPLSGENLRLKQTKRGLSRICRTCAREAMREYDAKRVTLRTTARQVARALVSQVGRAEVWT